MFDRLRSGINNVIKKIKIKELSEKELNKVLSELRKVLIKNEVSIEATEAITNQVKKELIGVEAKRFSDPSPIIISALRHSLLKILIADGTSIDLLEEAKKYGEKSEPLVILFLGINGTGKTTTIAKIGNLLKKNGYSVVFAAADTFRAGSIQQLSLHAEKLGIRVIKQDYGADPSAVAYDAVDHAFAKGINVVLIDTAGRMQNNENLMRELQKIKRVIDPQLTLFIGDALAGNDATRQAREFHEKIGISGSILTKADADVKGGAAISVTYATNKPITYLGVGQGYDDLVKFEPEQIVNSLLPKK